MISPRPPPFTMGNGRSVHPTPKMALASRISLLCLLALLFHAAESAHSRRRPVVITRARDDKYDRSITTFDAAGRLQQVEYGRKAAERGASILAYSHHASAVDQPLGVSNSNDEPQQGRDTSNRHDSIYILVPSSSSYKIHRLDHHVILLTTGLVGDGKFLATHLRKHCRNCRQAYGQAPTLKQVAQQAARVQHYLTRTAGARPLGLSAMIVGFDQPTDQDADIAESHGRGMPRIFQTDPGGVLEDCHYFAAGQHQDAILRTVSQRIETDKLNPGTSRHDVLVVLLQAMAQATDTNQLVLDVWMLDRDSSCRGDLQATCLLNVRADKIDELKAKLAEL